VAQKLLLSVERVTSTVARAALWVSGAGLVAMTAIMAAHVFWRYVLNDSVVWAIPGSVIVMGWFIFLGAAVGIREGYHLSFDVLLSIMPEKPRLFFYSVSDAIICLFGGGMVWFGTQLAVKTAGNKLPTLGISGAYDFMPIVFGGILIIIFTLERIARRLVGLPTARFGETPAEDA
jgi:TRAP-type C4-dicarboxylate transport system permease small subunit